MSRGRELPLMHESLLEIESLGTETRYRLPNRKLGEFKRFGWMFIGIGLFGVVFMLFWISMPFMGGVGMIANGEHFGWFLVAFSLLGLSALIPALGAVLFGSMIIRDQTRCEVVLTDSLLYSNERIGPFWWRRKIPIQNIQRLRISSSTIQHRSDPEFTSDIGGKFLALVAEGAGKQKLMIAPGYSHEFLEHLATALADAIDSEQIRESLQSIGRPDDKNAAASKVQIVDDSAETGPKKKIAEPIKPADTRIIVGERDGFTTFEVPPAGLRKGSKGLFGFSIAWILFMIIFTSMWIFIGGDALPWFLYLMVGIFWLVGISMLVAAINMGRRSVLMGVIEDQIFIERHSIFGKKWLEFTREQIERISVGPSGFEVNNVPVMELQIRTHGSETNKHGMLSQLTNDELRWLAWQLNNELGIG